MKASLHNILLVLALLDVTRVSFFKPSKFEIRSKIIEITNAMQRSIMFFINHLQNIKKHIVKSFGYMF